MLQLTVLPNVTAPMILTLTLTALFILRKRYHVNERFGNSFIKYPAQSLEIYSSIYTSPSCRADERLLLHHPLSIPKMVLRGFEHIKASRLPYCPPSQNYSRACLTDPISPRTTNAFLLPHRRSCFDSVAVGRCNTSCFQPGHAIMSARWR
ncbi:hypothetical protein DFH29DRAFT_131266 [Suillus ampliporus]|nr:hypothetical protein DFH29DRAFT_131266 [Suillus ampliporus]